jgi:hypothetical protein
MTLTISKTAAKASPIRGHFLAALASAYASIFFLIRYLADPERPGGVSIPGWYDRLYSYDQWQYYLMANAIHDGSLGPFQYPVLYPFLGYAGGFFYRKDPFVIPDLFLFAIAVYFSVRVFAVVLDNSGLTLAAAGLLIHSTCALFVKPWTTTVTAAALAVILFVYLERRASTFWGVICGFAVAATFGARIGDVVLAGAVAALIVWELVQKRTGARFLAAAAVTALAVVGAVLLVNHKFSGLWLGNYYQSAAGQQWCVACIPWKLYGYLIDPLRFQGAGDVLAVPMIQVAPLLLLAPLGLFFLFRNPSRRRAAAGFSTMFAGWFVIYGPFSAVTGSSLRYGSAHYAKVLFPVVICCACWALVVAVHPAPAERKSSLWYAAVVTAALLGIASISPHKLDLAGVRVSSNANPSAAWQAVDGDTNTRWDSAAPQKPGLEYNLDFERTVILNRIDLDTARSPGGFARRVKIEVSTDGKTWSEVVASAGTLPGAEAHYYFSPARVRQIRFVLTASDPSAYWSIYEIGAYGW